MDKGLAKPVTIVRYCVIAVWLGIILLGVISYIQDPSRFSAENVAAFVEQSGVMVWAVYLGLSIIRGITLLPSTPLVIAGTLLFPDAPFTVLLISMAGIVISSTMIYYFSELLGFASYFERHNPRRIARIKARLEHPLGFAFVTGWAFFPLVPTDLVCYLAGATRMTFWKFILAIAAGELLLCVCYIFLGGSLIGSVR